MEYVQQAPTVAANGGTCYECGNATGVVCFDHAIEGEGVLCICGACILTAAQIVWDAREREFKVGNALEGRYADVL